MSVTYKDIDDLSQKSSLTGTEKIPVSDTNYVTPDQIAVRKRVFLEDEEDMPASPDADTEYLIEETDPIVYKHLADESELPQNPDANTLYLIDGGGVNVVYLEDESEMPAQPSANTLYLIQEEE